MTIYEPDDTTDQFMALILECITTVKGRQDFSKALVMARECDWGTVSIVFKDGVLDKVDVRLTEYMGSDTYRRGTQ